MGDQYEGQYGNMQGTPYQGAPYQGTPQGTPGGDGYAYPPTTPQQPQQPLPGWSQPQGQQGWAQPQQQYAPQPQGQPQPQYIPQPQSSSIVLCQDGKYRWAYELGLFSNPTILFLIWKIFAGIGLGIWLLTVILACADNDWDIPGTLGDLAEEIPFVLIGLAVMLAVTGLGYAVYALMNGGKYCVAFEMDEHGVTHRQMPKQVQKAEVVGMINVLAGIAAGNPTQVGIGLTSSRSEMSSDFQAVRSIQGNRGRGVIKVNEPFAKNQVYVEPQDYDFVMGFITSHCPNAKVTNR